MISCCRVDQDLTKEPSLADITLLSKLTKTAEFMGKQVKADGSNIDAVFAQTDLTAAERTSVQSASKKALAVANVISVRAGIKFASTGHTGVMVPVMAIGDKEHEFTGLLDKSNDFP